MDIGRLRSMLERAGHPETPPHESSTAVKLARLALIKDGRTFTDLQLKGVPLGGMLVTSATLRERLDASLSEASELKSVISQLEREKNKLTKQVNELRERMKSKKGVDKAPRKEIFAWDGPEGVEGKVVRLFLMGKTNGEIVKQIGWQEDADDLPNPDQILQHTWNSPPPAYACVTIGNDGDPLHWEEFWLLGFLNYKKGWWKRMKSFLQMPSDAKFGAGDLSSAALDPVLVEDVRQRGRRALKSGTGNQLIQRQVLEMLVSSESGLTDYEMEEKINDHGSTYRTRRGELVKAGFVEAGPEKREIAGEKRTVWCAKRSVADFDREIRKVDPTLAQDA